MESNDENFYATVCNAFPNEIQKLSLESLDKTVIDSLENQISPAHSNTFPSPTDTSNKDLLEAINSSRPLGLDIQLNEWIEATKNYPIFVNSSVISKEQLKHDHWRLLEIQIQISEIIFTVLNNIPSQILCKLPGYDAEVYENLKVLDQNVKSRIKQIYKKLLHLDQEQVKDRMKNQRSEISGEPIDSILSNLSHSSNSSKRFIENNKFADNNDNKNTKDGSGQYVINPLAQNKYFINQKNTKNNANFQTNIQMMAQPQKLANMNCSEVKSWTNEISSQIRTLPTSKITLVPFSRDIKNQDKFYNNNYKAQKNIQKNTITEDIIPIDPEKFYSSSIAWNDSEDEMELEKKSNIYTDDFNDDASMVKFIDDVKNDGANGRYNNLDFPHCREMLKVFRMKFGLHQFRPNQLSAINAAILGHDCFILMPTGGGKSLCYQLPALLTHGITIVISPLRSLIIDQTQKLASLDIPAMHLTADLSDDQVWRVYRKLYEASPDLKLLYVTPEKLSLSAKFSSSLLALYRRRMLARFVIDEVHCVSQWGHDFRPDFKKLSLLKERFPDVPLIVLTATATRRVRTDILHQLHLNSPMWFISSFNRPNLRYTVIQKKTKSACQQIVDIIKSKFDNECGIVYCISRKDCDDHAKALFLKGVDALSYHAGLDDKLRIERQSQWISEKVKVICATIAFGMGIDKPNVRFVIHAAMPKSIEGYYQESGRAGRDGEIADCILLYNYGDMHRYRNIMERNDYANSEALKTHLDNLYKIVYFCENLADCRRAMQLNYFGEKFDRQECILNSDTTCDNCRTYDNFINLDVTGDARSLVELIQSLDNIRKNNITLLQVVDIYKGSNIANISYKLGYNYQKWFGRGHSMTKHEIERLLHNLVIEGYLCENMELNNGIVCAYVAPGRLANELLYQNNVQIFLQKKKAPDRIPVKSSMMQMSAVTNVVIKDLEQRCYSELFDIVNGIAGALDVSANSIMNIVALRAMSQQLPSNEAAMLKIPHVTKANFEKYGKALLDVTQKYSREKTDLLEEEEQNQLQFMDFEYYDSESDSDWMNHGSRSRTKVNKRSKNKTSSESKRLKNNEFCCDYNGFDSSRGGGVKNTRGNNASKNTRANKSSNIIREDKYFVSSRGNRSSNATRGKKPPTGRGRGIHTGYNNNGPGLCEFTKKYPIINPL